MSSPNSTTPPTIPPIIIHINLSPTLGADFIGVVLASILYGITVLQMIYYYQTYTKDQKRVKLLVAALWALDTTSLALVCHGVYTYLVVDFANLEDADSLVWSIAAEPAVTCVIALTVNSFLLYRIFTLRNHWWPITAIMFIWALAPFSIGIVAVWRTITGGQSLSAVSELHWMAIAGISLSSSLDLTIASILCYVLWKGRTVFKSTNQIIQTIMLYVIMSGLTTAVVNFLTLITYLAAPSTLLFQLFTMVSSKAYVNTVMATLNSRQSIRGIATENTLALPNNTSSVNTYPVFRPATHPSGTDRSDIDDYPLHQYKVSGEGENNVVYADPLASEDSRTRTDQTSTQFGGV